MLTACLRNAHRWVTVSVTTRTAVPKAALRRQVYACSTMANGNAEYDLVTIGAGSGGVRASRFAAQYYNAKVAVIELPFGFVSSDDIGGGYQIVPCLHILSSSTATGVLATSGSCAVLARLPHTCCQDTKPAMPEAAAAAACNSTCNGTCNGTCSQVYHVCVPASHDAVCRCWRHVCYPWLCAQEAVGVWSYVQRRVQ